ncbi:calcium-binding protein [Sphingomonas rhizophila]|uniref:Calcium-binding protein n=1 Tax=Sphingomonas rhizophila TaxID=2071607 RepID=A0A7G9SAF2_9SPHN|nr:calcium-binding protein [Sphingomonas rhizophila]QNN64827.1 calcium-binding protein [Sphingomonas rhizophila]
MFREIGEEALVGGLVGGFHGLTITAGLVGGGHIVLWQQRDGDVLTDVWFRAYDFDGKPTGEAFILLNDYLGLQYPRDLDVVALPDGGFAVAAFRALSLNEYGQAATHDIALQLFDGNGVARNAPVSVTNGHESFASAPDLTISSNRLIVTYQQGDIYGRTFDMSGNPVTEIYTLGSRGRTDNGDGTFTYTSSTDPVVAGLPGSRFVAAFTYNAQTAHDQSQSSIVARLFTKDGTPITAAFGVNTTTFGNQQLPQIVVLQNDDFIIMWTDSSTGTHMLRGQRFDASGQPVGAELALAETLSTSTTYSGWSATSLDNGGFALSWYYGPTVYVREFNEVGLPVRDPTPVSNSNGYDPWISSVQGGGYVIAWEGSKIRAQLFVEDKTLSGTGENDWLSGGYGADILDGLAGDDQLFGSRGDDRLIGRAGNDALTGGAGYDRMYGGTGDDTYFVNDADDYAYELVGEGRDHVVSSVDHQLRVNVEDLTLTGAASIGKGNVSDNVIVGSAAANKLYGYAGDDTLSGAEGDDVLLGAEGNDTLTGGAGYDRMYGGIGNDTFVVGDLADYAYENLGEGYDTVFTSINHQLRPNIEQLVLDGFSDLRGYGNALDNMMIGNSGNNLLYGKDGADTIRAGLGNDILYGENGTDYLYGGSGLDRFYGGAGADLFAFENLDFAGMGSGTADRIHDFSHAQGDRISLELVDANSNVGFDQAFTFVGSAAFSNVAGQLRYQQISGNTYVQGDTDGDGKADFWIRIDGLHALAATDFIL